MQFTQIRSATVKFDFAGKKFLIDLKSLVDEMGLSAQVCIPADGEAYAF